jgi:hypothetical protein
VRVDGRVRQRAEGEPGYPAGQRIRGRRRRRRQPGQAGEQPDARHVQLRLPAAGGQQGDPARGEHDRRLERDRPTSRTSGGAANATTNRSSAKAPTSSAGVDAARPQMVMMEGSHTRRTSVRSRTPSASAATGARGRRTAPSS